jgi:hypothetical protein
MVIVLFFFYSQELPNADTSAFPLAGSVSGMIEGEAGIAANLL